MTAHVLVPSLDEARPATLSPAILRLLRNELHFQGVLLSDDLDMQAVRARWAPPESAVAAIAAGCDGVLVCSGDLDVQAATLEALVRAVESGELSHARVEEALTRTGRAKARFLSEAPPDPRGRRQQWRHVVGCDAHRAIAAEMAGFL
jgi:beta-N-acetylhexosaminidase